jgi:hypothetical protein
VLGSTQIGSFLKVEVMRYMKAVKSTPSQDEFENVLIAELEELRKSEKALQKMYPRLRSKPQLRTHFLRQLADMQHRAHRLDAVLNPIGALQFAPHVSVPAQPSVA